jgi:hypothetical protein
LHFITFSSSISSVSGTLTLAPALALAFAFAFSFGTPSGLLLDDSGGRSAMASVFGASKIEHQRVYNNYRNLFLRKLKKTPAMFVASIRICFHKGKNQQLMLHHVGGERQGSVFP